MINLQFDPRTGNLILSEEDMAAFFSSPVINIEYKGVPSESKEYLKSTITLPIVIKPKETEKS